MKKSILLILLFAAGCHNVKNKDFLVLIRAHNLLVERVDVIEARLPAVTVTPTPVPVVKK